MQIQRPKRPDALVDEDQREAGDHPAPKLIPVTPAGAEIQDRKDPMSDFECLVSKLIDGPTRAQYEHQCQQEHGHYSQDDVRLCHETRVNRRLRLVEASLYESPCECVQDRLHEYDAAAPPM